MSAASRERPATRPAFQRLVNEQGEAVWRYLCAAVGPGEAADLYQETFLAALRAYPSLRHADNLTGWLVTIAHHAVVDAWRARRRQGIPVGTPSSATFTATLATDAPTPPRDDLWRAVDRLPDGQRAAVLLRYVTDLPYRDVGAVLGCSPAAARQRVHAGLSTLREEIHDA